MMYMEIALLPKSALKIKGKNASFVVNPHDGTVYNAALLIGKSAQANTSEEMVVIDGPGEFEVGGVKMSGVRSDGEVFYSLTVDSVGIVVGSINALEKMHQKMKEHNIVVVLCDEVTNASFLTSLSSNAIIFYGEKAAEIAQTFGKETKQMAKYSTTKDKLPLEMETVVLE